MTPFMEKKNTNKLLGEKEGPGPHFSAGTTMYISHRAQKNGPDGGEGQEGRNDPRGNSFSDVCLFAWPCGNPVCMFYQALILPTTTAVFSFFFVFVLSPPPFLFFWQFSSGKSLTPLIYHSCKNTLQNLLHSMWPRRRPNFANDSRKHIPTRQKASLDKSSRESPFLLMGSRTRLHQN